MVVHLREVPLSWSFEEFNQGGTHIGEHLRLGTPRQAANLTVAHRPNRLVLFRSSLLHETDALRFRPGFKNRRINFTLLFGIRGGHKKGLHKRACAESGP